MVAIFTYGLPIAAEKFKDAKVNLITLCDYDAVLDEAVRTDYIDEAEIATLQKWRKDPAKWDPHK
jgi:orotate phosphoribosyltransferase